MSIQALGADTHARSRLQIGAWWVDRTTNELGRAGDTVRVEPKAMEVLMVLADHAGRAVTREQLLAAVWPGVIVGDEALTQTIIKLRKALGDLPRSPSYIETISKRGYRLIAPVGPSGDVPVPSLGTEVARHGRPAAPEPPAAPGPSTASVRRRRHATVAILVAAVAALAMAAYFHHATSPTSIDADVAGVGESGSGVRSEWVTLTVLPFEWLGADPSQRYLARGISDDLVTDLSRLPGVRLIKSVGTSLGMKSAPEVQYLVTGTVQRESETLRINVHLIDAGTSRELWSERFDRPRTDLFAVQSEIVRKVVAILPGEFADAARRQIARRYTRSLEAYDDFLRGQSLFLVRRPEDNDNARIFYRKAVELDPGFARAYAGLAMTYAMEYRLRPSGDTSPALAKAVTFAETARAIDPGLPEAYWALAFVDVQSRRYGQAIGFLRKAIELDRSFADAYALLGGIYTYTGEAAKSIPLLRTALRLDPDGGYLYFLLLGRAYLFQNDIDQALINLREASMRNPADLETRLYLAAATAAAGDRVGAAWEVDEIRAAEPGFSLASWLDAYPLKSAGYRMRMRQFLAEAGL